MTSVIVPNRFRDRVASGHRYRLASVARKLASNHRLSLTAVGLHNLSTCSEPLRQFQHYAGVEARGGALPIFKLMSTQVGDGFQSSGTSTERCHGPMSVAASCVS
jgi:hypothetical protein